MKKLNALTFFNKFISIAALLFLLPFNLNATSNYAITLDGDWLFCPAERYIVEVDIRELQCQPIKLPGGWESVKADYDGFGLLITRFSIDRSHETENLGLFVGRIRDADKTFVNGKLIGETGEFPPLFQKAVLYSRTYQIPNNYLNYDSDNVLSIWVYNDARPGGLSKNLPVISDYFELLQNQISKNYQMLMFIVVLLVFSIFHAIYFYFHRQAKENLYFSLFVAAWALYLYTFSHLGLSSSLSLNFLFRANVALFFINFSLFPWFIYAFFNETFPKIIKIITGFSLAMVPLCYFLPEPGMLYWPLEIVELSLLPLMVLVLAFLYRCVKEGRPYAKRVTWVIMLYILFGTVDIVVDFAQINLTGSLWLFGPWALIVLSFALTFFVAHKNYSYYQDATVDRLTSTLRRDEFILRLNQEIVRAQRDKMYMLVMMVDMDNFKIINDRYGHFQGDRVLIQVTQALKKRLRLFDHIGRYGGDEFCICAAFEQKNEVEGFVNRLHQAVNGLSFKVEENEQEISATFGAVIQSPSERKIASQLLEEADQLLVAAKSQHKGEILW